MNTRIALATLFLLVSSSALAADAFSSLDSNGNGLLSPEEASRMQGLIEHWEDLDSNEDGNLDVKEFVASMAGEAKAELADVKN